MSVATIGAVGLTDTDLIIPGVPQIPYALLLTGAGSTTEVIEVRSLQRGGHVYVTRGAFGSLPVAHTAPVVVTLYDPNSGGGGGGVTVEVPPAAPVSVTNIVAAGATISGGTATLPLAFQRIGPYRVTYQTPNINTGVDVGAIPAGAIVLRVFGKAVTAWAANGSGPEMRLGIAATVSGGTQSLYTSENVDTGPQTFGVDAEYDQSPSFTRYPIGFMNEAGTIHVECFDEDDGSLPTAGSADIYALIAVPAS